jgi:hypothetical protein
MATPPDFSVGQVLTSATMNQVGLWKISSGTMAGTAETTISSIPTDYRSLRLSIRVTAVGNTGAQDVYIRLGTTLNSTYAYSLVRSFSTTVGALSSDSAAYWLIGSATQSSAQVYTANVDIIDLTETSPTVMNQQGFGFNSVNWINYAGGGAVNNNTAYTDLRIGTPASTLTGTWVLYGVRP